VEDQISATAAEVMAIAAPEPSANDPRPLCKRFGITAERSWRSAKLTTARNQPKGPISIVVVVVVDAVVVVTVVLVDDELVVKDVVMEVIVDVEEVEDVVLGQGIGQSARNSRCKKVWTSSKVEDRFKPSYHSGWLGKPCSIVQVAA
jgi:hypothetical protein